MRLFIGPRAAFVHLEGDLLVPNVGGNFQSRRRCAAHLWQVVICFWFEVSALIVQ